MAQRYEFIRDEIEHYISALVDCTTPLTRPAGKQPKHISWKKHVEQSNCGGISAGDFSCGPNLKLQAINW